MESEHLVQLTYSILIHLHDLIKNPLYGENERENSKGKIKGHTSGLW
jgi:hypothetical protein